MKGKGECGAGGAVILNKVSVADTNTDTTAIFTGMYVYGRVCACACVDGCVHVCVGVGSFSCVPSFGCPTLVHIERTKTCQSQLEIKILQMWKLHVPARLSPALGPPRR